MRYVTILCRASGEQLIEYHVWNADAFSNATMRNVPVQDVDPRGEDGVLSHRVRQTEISQRQTVRERDV
jgi:hypothetical protein